MSSSTANVHATAIVIGTAGLIFIGPSGAGKSSLALHCIHQARSHGLNAALVSDDQILVTAVNGSLVARAPSSIAGLAELRGSAIVRVETMEACRLRYAISPVRPPFHERIAPEVETAEILPGHFLPLIRLPLHDGCDAFAALAARAPEIVGL